MVQETNPEKSVEASNERAVAWARRMMARKCAEQKRIEEEYEINYKAS
ncbi:hypothetical protein [Spirosoma harenae]